MSGRLFDAAAMEQWNVLNRVLPDDELAPKALRFAHQLASGPTMAHAATKAVVRKFIEGGVREADRRTPEITAPLIETQDVANAVQSFLKEGPGKARFEGR